MKRFLSITAAGLLLVSQSVLAGGNVRQEACRRKFNCASCHGKDFQSPIDPAYPKLAGQHQDYLVQALKAYQRGDKGRTGGPMPSWAGRQKH
jgi:cytochrome c553